jgi:hypothetical protein
MVLPQLIQHNLCSICTMCEVSTLLLVPCLVRIYLDLVYFGVSCACVEEQLSTEQLL